MSVEQSAMIDRRQKLLGPAYRLFYKSPLHIVRGEGVWLFDADGNRYLDMYNNVPHVGHCHPHVVDAVTKQLSTLNTHSRYLHENILALAERLVAKFPVELDNVMFSCTGSEANELALRIARAATGGTGLIVTDHAYHGNTKATYEISTEDIPKGEIPAWVVSVPAPDCYRGQYRGENAATEYAEHISDAIEKLASRGIKPAAFIVDTIMSSAGVITLPQGYLQQAAAKVREAGGLFIADEVQPGFGRTGENFWGFEFDDVVPDIVTMGKPMGNGYPLAATVARSDLLKTFSLNAHYFNTFGGSPVSAAAGLAVLDVIERESLQSNANDTGQHLSNGLQALATKYELIGDIRGTGLFKSVELVVDLHSRKPATDITAKVVNQLRCRGVLIGSTGKDSNILKLRPPMVFDKENADSFLSSLDDVLSTI